MIVCTEVIWVALILPVPSWSYQKSHVRIAVTLFGSILIALSDYSAPGSDLLYGDLALTAAVMSAFYT
ncbi:MAG: hypothetical protein ACLT46_06190 [Hungatella sp.]